MSENESNQGNATVRVAELKQRLQDARPDTKRAGPGQNHRKQARTGGIVPIDPETPGYQFVHQLIQAIQQRNLNLGDAAEEMGVSASTLSQLRSGRRLASALDEEILERMATWMNIPMLAAMILADRLELKHFYVSRENSLQHDIDRALRYISEDPSWGGLMPRGIDKMAMDYQLFVIWSYEQATGLRLLSGGVNYTQLLSDMDEFRNVYPMDPKSTPKDDDPA